MPSSLPNHYETLGLLPTATPEEIKRRYRELARRYHPDVARTSDAADRFKEINEANAILSDVSKRANYDAHLKLEELKRQQPRGGEGERERGGEGARQGPRPAEQRPAQRTAAPKPAAKSQQDAAAQALHEAQRALSRLKFREAEVLARRANKIRRTSLGYEILGDVFRARGSNDEAVAMYSYALQLDRSNHEVQRKFDRLVGQQSGPTMAGRAARAARRSGRSQGGTGRPASVAAAVIGFMALAALLVATSRIGSPATGPWLLDWDGLYVFALAASGVVAGFLLATLGALPPAGSELFAAATHTGRSHAFPLGPLVIAFALLNYYAALLVFLVAGFLTDRIQRPLLLAFAASFAATLVFAIVNVSAAPWTLLSGAGVILLGFLGGWGAAGALGMDVRR